MADDSILVQAYLAHRAVLVEAAVPILGCRFRAEDVVQDAYLRLSEAAGPADLRQPVSYLFRLVRNLAIDRARRLALEIRFGAREEVPLTAASAAGTPEDHMLARAALRRLEAALGELPDRTRLAFEMNRIGGLPPAAVARALGISERLVYGLLRDAMTHCRGRVFGAGG